MDRISEVAHCINKEVVETITQKAISVAFSKLFPWTAGIFLPIAHTITALRAKKRVADEGSTTVSHTQSSTTSLSQKVLKQ